MPDPTLSEAIQEAYASAPTDEVILETLELRHPTFDEPIRVVMDYFPHELTLEDEAIENPGDEVTFLAYAFSLQPPDVSSQGSPQMNVSIDNVSSEIEAAVARATEVGGKVLITYRAYLASDTSAPQNDPPLTMTLSNVKANDKSVTGIATFADIVNKKFPGEDYTAKRFPGLVT